MKTITILEVLRDLMLGGKHSRTTVARGGVSLPTADRWLVELLSVIPGVRREKIGKTAWFSYRQHQWNTPEERAVNGETRARVRL